MLDLWTSLTFLSKFTENSLLNLIAYFMAYLSLFRAAVNNPVNPSKSRRFGLQPWYNRRLQIDSKTYLSFRKKQKAVCRQVLPSASILLGLTPFWSNFSISLTSVMSFLRAKWIEVPSTVPCPDLRYTRLLERTFTRASRLQDIDSSNKLFPSFSTICLIFGWAQIIQKANPQLFLSSYSRQMI